VPLTKLWILNHLPLVTGLAIVAALVLFVIFLFLLRYYPHEPSRAGFGAAMASLVIAGLFSVMLNSWYAEKRDRDNRLRSLRDQHYSQLKLVLRIESSKLTEITETIRKQAYMNRVNQYPYGGNDVDLAAMLWPDVMSPDLANHFPQYDQSKRALQSQIEAEDQEFRESMVLVRKTLNRNLDPVLREMDAMSYVEKCAGRGNGVVLQIGQGSFNFEYWGATTGGGGQPSADQIAAFRAFQSMKPTANVTSHCNSLKEHAEAIRSRASELSKQAQILSESTILTGTCQFMTSRNLSD
jgi:hypothetical protein